jgi:enamine deaminase RidA (YjgF/YER057c/UK114 family)
MNTIPVPSARSVVKLTQYFRDLRDFPIYNRIRSQFFADPPASTVVQVSALLPTSAAGPRNR